MPLLNTFTVTAPELGDTTERLLAKLLSIQSGSSVTRGTLLASATRTATTSTAEQNWSGKRAVFFFLNVSSASGTGGLTFLLEYQDPITSTWIPVCAQSAAAAVTTGLRPFMVGQGIAAGNNMTLSPAGLGTIGDRGMALSSKTRVRITHGDATNYTYSLGYELIG